MSMDVQAVVGETEAKRSAVSNSPRVLLLFSALLVMVFARDSAGLTAPRLVALLMAAAMTGVALIRPALVTDLDRLRRAEPAFVAVLVPVGLILTGGALARAIAHPVSPLWFAVLSAYVILGLTGALSWVQRLPHLKWAFWVFLAFHAALTVVFLRATPAGIDVQVFLPDGSVALLPCHHSYSITFPNI